MPYKNNEDRLRNAARYRAIPENRDRNARYMKSLYATDRQAILADRKKYYVKNKSKIKSQRREREYGLTDADYTALLVKQGHRCPVCGDPFSGAGKSAYAPAIDHCHVTNSVRGILHNLCNRALGMFKDNPLICGSAAVYLRDNG